MALFDRDNPQHQEYLERAMAVQDRVTEEFRRRDAEVAKQAVADNAKVVA